MFSPACLAATSVAGKPLGASDDHRVWMSTQRDVQRRSRAQSWGEDVGRSR